MNDITLFTYGRHVSDKTWYFDKHIGVNRLYYIHSGSVLFDNGNIRKKICEKRLYLFAQNIEFKLEIDENTKVDHTFFDFCAVPNIVMNSICEIDIGKDSVLTSAFEILSELAGMYPKKVTNGEGTYHLLIRSYLENFLTLLSEKENICTVSDDIINAAMEFIHKNYASDISVASLSEIYNMDKSAFIRKFRKSTGVTPFEYIKNHRLNIARQMRAGGKYSLGEIASAVGYSDSVSLLHALKKQRKL